MIKILVTFLIVFLTPHYIFSSQHEKSFYALQFEKITEQENEALLQELYSLPSNVKHIQISKINTPLLCNFLLKPINEFIKKNQFNISPKFVLAQQPSPSYSYVSHPYGLFAKGEKQVTIGIHLLITLLKLSLFQGIAFWLAHEIGHLIQNHNQKLIFSTMDLSRHNKEVDADSFACAVSLKNEQDKAISTQALCTILVTNALSDLLAKRQKKSTPSMHMFITTVSCLIMQKIPQSYWHTIQHYEEIDKIFEITLNDLIKNNPNDIIDMITQDHTFDKKFINQLIKNSSDLKLIKDISAKALCSLSHPSPKERFGMINKTQIS